MGMLIDGRWVEEDPADLIQRGEFVRKPSVFRNWVTADGDTGFPAEAGRYVLYVSWGCPWAHRAVLMRTLKNLEPIIPVVLCERHPERSGWAIAERPHRVPGTDHDADFLDDLYVLADPTYTGRVTTPTLWDTVNKTVVSNESADVIRMLNAAFANFTNCVHDYYPEPLRDDIDAINEIVYPKLNNGVYRAGFAMTQEAYETAYDGVFEALDVIEDRLRDRRYLCGDQQTEADWRAFPTLFRFDAIYYLLFKCNARRIADYENISGYLRDLYQTPGIAEVCDLAAAKKGYYSSMRKLNPSRIIPKGPIQDLAAPHDRK